MIASTSTIPNAGAIGPLGKRDGDSGAITRGGSSIQSGTRVGSGGLGDYGGNSGAIDRNPDSSIPSGTRVGSGGLGDYGGDSGAIDRNPGSSIPSGTRVGSGGLGDYGGNSGAIDRNPGSSIPSGTRVGSGGLGDYDGDSGAIDRNPGSSIPSGTRVGSGGLGDYDGDSGAIKRNNATNRFNFTKLQPGALGRRGKTLGSDSSLDASGGTSLGGSGKPVGGGSRGRNIPDYQHIVCGSPVSGVFDLEIEYAYDLTTGREIAPKVKAWKAEINGIDWTPEDWTNSAAPASPGINRLPPSGFTVQTDTNTRLLFKGDNPHSLGCEVYFNAPDPKGKIIKSDSTILTVPNGLSDEFLVKSDKPGTGIFAEHMHLHT